MVKKKVKKEKEGWWIQRAFRKHKEGTLHRMLGVPVDKTIPFTLLEKIRGTEIGKVISNPTMTGKRRIKVTLLLKRRAVAALNVKNIRR